MINTAPHGLVRPGASSEQLRKPARARLDRRGVDAQQMPNPVHQSLGEQLGASHAIVLPMATDHEE
jgi:hypothetical protein